MKKHLKQFLLVLSLWIGFLIVFSGTQSIAEAAIHPLRQAPISSDNKPFITNNISVNLSAITPDEVIHRAQIWVDQKVIYDQSAYHPEDGYRQDCSGFISYAFKLTVANGNPDSKNTKTLVPITFPITKEELQKGDILLWEGEWNPAGGIDGGHVVLFDHWLNQEKTSYWGLEQTPPYAIAHALNYPYSSRPNDYKPRRFKGITNAAVILYDQPGFAGEQLILTQSDEDLCDNIISGQTNNPNPCFDSNVTTWNDRISSIKVMPGYGVTLLLHSKDWDIDKYGQQQARFSCGTDIADFSTKLFNGTFISLDNNVSKVLIEKCTSNTSTQVGVLNSTIIAQNNPCNPDSPSFDAAGLLSEVISPNSTLLPTQAFVKTWTLKNIGLTTWGSGYQLVFVNGEQMGAPASVNIPTTAPTQQVDLSINLTAPTTIGDHIGYWQLRNPQGTYFGPKIWVKITVQGTAPPATSDIDVVSVTYPTVVTPGQVFRPQVVVRVNQGQLLQSRGDLLRNTDGNLFGAWPHVTVVGTVNAGQTYLFEFYQANPITAPSSEGSYDSRWRVWRDGNWAGPEITIHFDVRNGSVTRPNAPVISSPGNWSQFLQGNTPQLCVNPVAGLAYYFQIYNSHDNPESGWTGNCWTPPGLGPYTYKWHVKAKNSAGLESGWSEDRNFTMNSNQLSMDNLEFSPGSPSSGESIRVYTCVQGFGGIGLGLKIEANTATDGSASGDWYWIHHLGMFCYNHGDTNTWPNWETLPLADGNHLVRAVGSGPQGQTLEKTAVFTLNRRRPNAPKLVNPTNDAFIKDHQVTFSWNPAWRVNSYRLLVSTNSDPGVSPLIDQTFGSGTTQYTATFSQAYANLYWKVIASNELGSSDSVAHFSLDWASPSSSVTAFPSSTSYETAFAVSWGGTDDCSSIRWYNIQYRDGNRPDSQWVDWMTNTTQIASTFMGQTGHTYYFQSQALDVAGNLENWSMGDGDTSLKIDINSRPPTLWWNTGYAQKRSLLILNNDPGILVSGYPIHLHFDNTTTPSATVLYASSQAAIKGDDFRIIKNDNTELPRFIQTFTPDVIDIWFELKANIDATPGSDGTSYQLYYGNSQASSPPDDPNLIFKPFTDTNTLGLWSFSEGSGTTIYDSSGHGNTGTASNINWAQGKFGWAGAFNGSNSIINLGSSNSFNLQQFSAEAWVKFSDLNSFRSIFNKHASDGSEIFDLRIDGNKIASSLNHGNCNKTGNTALQTGRWYHLAWEYDGNTTRVFVNGSLDGSLTCVLTLRTGDNTPLGLGGDFGSAGKNLNGLIQLARISNIPRYSYGYGSFANIMSEPSISAGINVQPPTSGQPDLVVQSVTSYPNPSGGLIIQAVVTNQGNQSTGNGFNTDLYLNHVPGGTGDYAGSIRFWVNDPIAAGATVTLTTTVSDLGGLGFQAQVPGQEISGTLYTQTDTLGTLNDSDRSNNISVGIDVCTASADAYENDDVAASASTIQINQIQVHNFTTRSDQDWVKFHAEAGKTYVIRTSNLGPSADTYLYLYAQDGTTLLSSNDDANSSLASSITWTASTTGTYYILVQSWNPNMSGCGTSYHLRVGPPDKYFYMPTVRR